MICDIRDNGNLCKKYCSGVKLLIKLVIMSTKKCDSSLKSLVFLWHMNDDTNSQLYISN